MWPLLDIPPCSIVTRYIYIIETEISSSGNTGSPCAAAPTCLVRLPYRVWIYEREVRERTGPQGGPNLSKHALHAA